MGSDQDYFSRSSRIIVANSTHHFAIFQDAVYGFLDTSHPKESFCKTLQWHLYPSELNLWQLRPIYRKQRSSFFYFRLLATNSLWSLTRFKYTQVAILLKSDSILALSNFWHFPFKGMNTLVSQDTNVFLGIHYTHWSFD